MFVVHRADVIDAMRRDGFLHGFNVRVRFVPRHMNRDRSKPRVLILSFKSLQFRHIILADTAACRPKIDERRLAIHVFISRLL